MATRRKRSRSADAAAVATTSNRRMLNTITEEELQSSSSDICTYWPTNPLFDPKSVLLRRLFFINEDRTKYVSVGFHPARDYQPLVEFGAILRGGSNSIILGDEQLDTLVECLPAMRESMCGGDRVTRCEIVGNFRLRKTRKKGRPDCVWAQST